MNNPSTIDQRDVSHSTNPVGGQGYVDELFSFTTATLAHNEAGLTAAELRIKGRRLLQAANMRAAH
ncbi:hypothetical protein [Rhizobium sp.]